MGLGFEVSKARQNFEGWTSWKWEFRATRPGVDSFSIVQKCKQDREGGLKVDNGLVASNLSFDLGPVAFAGRQEGTGDLTWAVTALHTVLYCIFITSAHFCRSRISTFLSHGSPTSVQTPLHALTKQRRLSTASEPVGSFQAVVFRPPDDWLLSSSRVYTEKSSIPGWTCYRPLLVVDC